MQSTLKSLKDEVQELQGKVNQGPGPTGDAGLSANGKIPTVGVGGRTSAVGCDQSRPIRVAVHEEIPGLAQDGIYLSGTLYAKPMTCLVDTGANVSIIQAGIFFTVPPKERPQQELKGLSMVLADGNSVPILGKAEMVVTIGDKGLSYEFWVADIGPDCILGLDFLRRHNCVINARMGRVMLGCEQQMHEPSEAAREVFSSRIISAETFVLPANSEMIVEARVKNFQKEFADEVGIIQLSVELLEKKGRSSGKVFAQVGSRESPETWLERGESSMSARGVEDNMEASQTGSTTPESDTVQLSGPVKTARNTKMRESGTFRGMRLGANEGLEL
ncbi:hypothetical protein HOLleu_05290 [Holothuria leucospilota]|uniref:Peptidase A2 domain-containing protein n=1 Tax=Holothuria leucospilota TaxID=206669 RepID=A0A9Q1HIV3_HOLLE|nr:hypothetical protein HOLleu_05290 [Holothuria leucospilota]